MRVTLLKPFLPSIVLVVGVLSVETTTVAQTRPKVATTPWTPPTLKLVPVPTTRSPEQHFSFSDTQIVAEAPNEPPPPPDGQSPKVDAGLAESRATWLGRSRYVKLPMEASAPGPTQFCVGANCSCGKNEEGLR